MRIGATYTERADACAEWIGSGLPGHRSAIDVKGTIGKINLRIGFLIMETGWKPAMMQCQNGFDKTNDPGSTISMSYIRFHRADGAKACFLSVRGKSLFQSLNLYRITQSGTRPMCLDVCHSLRRNAGQLQGAGNNSSLSLDTRSSKADFHSAIIVDG